MIVSFLRFFNTVALNERARFPRFELKSSNTGSPLEVDANFNAAHNENVLLNFFDILLSLTLSNHLHIVQQIGFPLCVYHIFAYQKLDRVEEQKNDHFDNLVGNPFICTAKELK